MSAHDRLRLCDQYVDSNQHLEISQTHTLPLRNHIPDFSPKKSETPASNYLHKTPGSARGNPQNNAECFRKAFVMPAQGLWLGKPRTLISRIYLETTRQTDMMIHMNRAFLKAFNSHLSDDDLPVTDPEKSPNRWRRKDTFT